MLQSSTAKDPSSNHRRNRPLSDEERTVLGRFIGAEHKNVKALEAQSQAKITVLRQSAIRIEAAPDKMDRAFEIVNERFALLLKPDDVSQHSTGTTQPKLVYMDILNYSGHFFNLKSWSVTTALKETAAFIAAAKASGVTIVGFIDKGYDMNGEALKKWRTRRLREVRMGKKDVPHGLSTMLGEMFRKQGIEIRYSTDADNDDTLASHAFHDDAAILSQDGDFQRYDHPQTGQPVKFKLFTDFRIADKGLKLRKRPMKPFVGTRSKLISPPLPYRLADEFNLFTYPADKPYLRGAPSPLVRLLGYNPHIIVRPLRSFLYSTIFDEDVKEVTEIFPVWNSATEEAEFEETVVPIARLHEPSLLDLAQDPKASYIHYFGSLLKSQPQGVAAQDWSRHCFGCRAVIIELCCSFPGSSLNFLELMIEQSDWGL